MEGKELLVNEACDWQSIEALHEQIVRVLIVFVYHLRAKIEELSHLSTFVVAPQHVDGFRIIKFEREEQKYYLAREAASVHIVA